jgi:uncharacterized protein (TIGR02118 family)
MIVVSVLYPNVAGSKFDINYYRDTHLPLCRELLAPMGMQSLSFYRPNLADPAAAYQLVAELRFPDMATANAALAAHGPRTQADIPNFTDAKPVILVGEEVAA